MSGLSPSPSKKVKPSIHLRNVHNEQLTKLQTRHQQELELLEDAKTYFHKRASIEKDYATSLAKLTESLSKKKEIAPTPTDWKPEEGECKGRTASSVWRTLLEETEKHAQSRLSAAECYEQQFESTKNLKNNKTHVIKKALEQAKELQTELNQSISELTKNQKTYSDIEHEANDARLKASEAQDKIQKKKTGLFQSMSSLQKKSATFTSKADEMDRISTAARNDYLLSLSMANAHQRDFYNNQIPRLLATIDGGMYDGLKDYFNQIAEMEFSRCKEAKESFELIKEDSKLISRDFESKSFYHANPVITEVIQYQFEPCESDKINYICKIHESEPILRAEAKRLATRVAISEKESRAVMREMEMVKEGGQFAQVLSSPSRKNYVCCASAQDLSDSGAEVKSDPESKLEELEQAVRKADLEKMKAMSKLDLLRNAGLPIADILERARRQMPPTPESERKLLMRMKSSKSLKSEGEASQPTPEKIKKSTSSPEATPSSPTESGQVVEVAAFEAADDTISHASDGGGVAANQTSSSMDDATSAASHALSHAPLNVGRIALYDFVAQNDDELTIYEGDEIWVSEDGGEGDGWIRGRNAEGAEGLMPENYIGTREDYEAALLSGDGPEEVAPPPTDLPSPPLPLQPPSSQSNGWDDANGNVGVTAPPPIDAAADVTEPPPLSPAAPLSPPPVSPKDAGSAEWAAPPPKIEPTPVTPPAQAAPPTQPVPEIALLPVQPNGEVMEEGSEDGNVDGDLSGYFPDANDSGRPALAFVRALYDYTANTPEEISFHEGEIIKVVQKNIDGVEDDEWWEGEIGGKIGAFPTILCELVGEEDEEDDESYTESASSGTATPPEPAAPPPSKGTPSSLDAPGGSRPAAGALPPPPVISTSFATDVNANGIGPTSGANRPSLGVPPIAVTCPTPEGPSPERDGFSGSRKGGKSNKTHHRQSRPSETRLKPKDKHKDRPQNFPHKDLDQNFNSTKPESAFRNSNPRLSTIVTISSEAEDSMIYELKGPPPPSLFANPSMESDSAPQKRPASSRPTSSSVMTSPSSSLQLSSSPRRGAESQPSPQRFSGPDPRIVTLPPPSTQPPQQQRPPPSSSSPPPSLDRGRRPSGQKTIIAKKPIFAEKEKNWSRLPAERVKPRVAPPPAPGTRTTPSPLTTRINPRNPSPKDAAAAGHLHRATPIRVGGDGAPFAPPFKGDALGGAPGVDGPRVTSLALPPSYQLPNGRISLPAGFDAAAPLAGFPPRRTPTETDTTPTTTTTANTTKPRPLSSSIPFRHHPSRPLYRPPSSPKVAGRMNSLPARVVSTSPQHPHQHLQHRLQHHHQHPHHPGGRPRSNAGGPRHQPFGAQFACYCHSCQVSHFRDASRDDADDGKGAPRRGRRRDGAPGISEDDSVVSYV